MNRRALLAALALSGCGLSTRDYVEKHEWPLAATRPGTLPPPAHGRVLLVRETRSGPLTQQRGLQTLQPDGSVAFGFYDEWAVPPAESMEASLRAWLAASGLFAATLAPGSRLSADLVLESQLTAIVADPGAGQARLSLAVVLLDQRQTTQVLLQRTYTASPPLASADAATIVAALQAALGDVLAQVEQAVAPYAQERDPARGRPKAGGR